MARQEANSGIPTSSATQGAARTRTNRSFPATSFEDALFLGTKIQKYAAGEKVRRLTLFEKMGKSPDSGPTRAMITSSGKYGITKGSYSADWLEMTPEGRTATNPDSTPRQLIQARFKLAIESVPAFKSLYEAFEGKRLPDQAILRDHLKELGIVDEAQLKECAQTFMLNAKFVGLLKTLGGAERLMPIEAVLDEAPAASIVRVHVDESSSAAAPGDDISTALAPYTWEKTCFYVTPIGDEDSDERRHSDLFLGSIVEPALAEFSFDVVRADRIAKAGMITSQVIEHIMKAKLVIADLSFHNPNVFYELALRHATKLPIVQIIRKSDRIPFDLEQFRTIQVDTQSIYTLVPQLEYYRAQIASQVRRELEQDADVENPLTVFAPEFFAATLTQSAN
jgi:hypothetical protein